MRKGDVGHFVTIARLKKRIAELETENAELRARVEQLEDRLRLERKGQRNLGRYAAQEP